MRRQKIATVYPVVAKAINPGQMLSAFMLEQYS